MDTVSIELEKKALQKSALTDVIVGVGFLAFSAFFFLFVKGGIRLVGGVSAAVGGAIAMFIGLASVSRISKSLELNHPIITLTPEGITYLFPTSDFDFKASDELKTIPWSNIVAVSTIKRGVLRMITLKLIDAPTAYENFTEKERKIMEKLCQQCDCHIAISTVGTSILPDDIKVMIDKYRKELNEGSEK